MLSREERDRGRRSCLFQFKGIFLKLDEIPYQKEKNE